MIRRITLGALIAVLGAPNVVAQTPPGATIFTDSVAPRVRPDGGSLSPVVLTYVATLQQGLDSRPLGERTVSLTKSTYGGVSAWEMIETRGAGASASVDTLIVDYLGLTPFHWGAVQPMPGGRGGQMASARLAAEFRADTMMGVMSSPAGRRTVVASVPPGAYVNAAHFEVAMRGLPLSAGWRDSAWVMVTNLGKTAPLAAAVTITGEEKLLTMAGTFDCWIVSLATAMGRTQYWVSKADRIVVQSTQVVPESGDVLMYQLSRISH